MSEARVKSRGEGGGRSGAGNLRSRVWIDLKDAILYGFTVV